MLFTRCHPHPFLEHHVRADPGSRRAGDGVHSQAGDIVTIAAPELGALVNRMKPSSECEPWTFGIGALMANLAQRDLITITPEINDDEELHRGRVGGGDRGVAGHQPVEHRRRGGRVRPRRRRRRRAGDRGRHDAFPAWSRSTLQLRHDILKRVGDEILARKDEIGRLLSREEGKTLAEGIGEVTARRPDLPVLLRRGLRLTGDKLASVRPRRRHRDHPRAGGRGRADHALELPDRDPGLEDRAGPGLRQLRRAQARRAGAGLGPRALRDHRPRRRARPACSTWSWAAARWWARRCCKARR